MSNQRDEVDDFLDELSSALSPQKTIREDMYESALCQRMRGASDWLKESRRHAAEADYKPSPIAAGQVGGNSEWVESAKSGVYGQSVAFLCRLAARVGIPIPTPEDFPVLRDMRARDEDRFPAIEKILSDNGITSTSDLTDCEEAAAKIVHFALTHPDAVFCQVFARPLITIPTVGLRVLSAANCAAYNTSPPHWYNIGRPFSEFVVLFVQLVAWSDWRYHTTHLLQAEMKRVYDLCMRTAEV